MERVLSPDEKIRRAEEIYFRRTQNNNINRVAKVNVESKKKNSYVKKLCIQFIVCLGIYAAFYSIQNREDLLPKSITNKINEILQYDINIEALQGKINSYIVEVNGKVNEEKKDNQIENSEQSAGQENIPQENTRFARGNIRSN